MNYHISKWLKDELGLSHMSEADLNCLIFHPRYGSLCRRFVNFLAESTLCNIKFSTVYAEEEHKAAAEELEAKNGDLISSVRELEEVARNGENNLRELNFLKSRLSQMKTIQQLLMSHSESLDALANRPNFLIEQVSWNIDNCDYLADSSLASMYDFDPDFKHEAIITGHKISTLDNQLKEMVNKIESIHISATNLAQRIVAQMNSPEYDVKITKTSIDDLLALQIPPIEEELEDPYQDEKALRDMNTDMARKVIDLDQQVSQMGEQHRRRKAEIREAKSRQLQECLLILGRTSITNLSKNGTNGSSLDDASKLIIVNQDQIDV